MRRVLVIGDATHVDFAESQAVLRQSSRVWFVPNAAFADTWLRVNRPVDWVVLLQSRPGELPREIVSQLQSQTGSAKFVSLLGSWCEGELRTGQPWPDVPRCYWYAFPSWWHSFNSGATGSVSETALGPIAISAAEFETAQALLDALAIEGCSASWWPQQHPQPRCSRIAAGIWVGKQLSGREASQLDEFCRRMRVDRAAVIALLDFPRRDRVELAKRIGVNVVLGKPWLTTDITRSIRDSIATRQTSQSSQKVAIWSA